MTSTTTPIEEEGIPVIGLSSNNNEDYCDGDETSSAAAESAAEQQESSSSSDPSILTQSEIKWAKEIKSSIRKEDETLAKTITDLEYGQLAIITKGKLDRAIKMVHRLSIFKQEHDIDTDGANIAPDDITSLIEKAMESITNLEKKSPGFLMSFGREEDDDDDKDEKKSKNKTSVIAFNLTAFNPRKYHIKKSSPSSTDNADANANADTDSSDTDTDDATAKEWKILYTGLYYLFEASSSTIATIRAGTDFICNCDLIGYNNYSTDITKYGSSLYQDSYPIRVNGLNCVNTPFIFRAIYAIVKPFVSAHTTKVLNMSSTVPQIQDTYSPQILPKSFDGKLGSWEMKNKLTAALKLRYETKATFTL